MLLHVHTEVQSEKMIRIDLKKSQVNNIMINL